MPLRLLLAGVVGPSGALAREIGGPYGYVFFNRCNAVFYVTYGVSDNNSDL